MDLNPISKYIALILRHKPEEIGITLDEHGWADTNELIAGVKKKYPEFGLTHLIFIVESDEKQRYSFGDDMRLIRANQGHSIPVDLELEPVKPPVLLWHGTGQKYVDSIEKEGLIPKSRQYVHLSSDHETALEVGKRHGEPALYLVNALGMYTDGYEFFLSANGVWLTKEVPFEYLIPVNV